METELKSWSQLKSELPFKPGDKVRIKKGTRIKTTSNRNIVIAQRTYTVKLHNVSPSYQYDQVIIPARVEWVGAGGYWHEADLSDVEKV